jgi:hypothetical protein
LGKNPDFQLFLHSGDQALSPSTRPSDPEEPPFSIPLMAVSLFPLGRANKGTKARNKETYKMFLKIFGKVLFPLGGHSNDKRQEEKQGVFKKPRN